MWLKLIALIAPLGLDTFAIAAALGISGLKPADRTRVTALFTAFEMGMPLVGFVSGSLLGEAVGNAADYVAIVILIGLGVFMLWARRENDEEQRLGLLARTRGFAAIGLGISISLDELAIGFTLGLLRQLGIRLGQQIGERIREGAERVAGIALGLLGLLLLIDKLKR